MKGKLMLKLIAWILSPILMAFFAWTNDVEASVDETGIAIGAMIIPAVVLQIVYWYFLLGLFGVWG